MAGKKGLAAGGSQENDGPWWDNGGCRKTNLVEFARGSFSRKRLEVCGGNLACRKLRGGGLYGRGSVSESSPYSKAGRG